MTLPIMLEAAPVAIAGDWHGSAAWATAMLRAIRDAHPEVATVLHLGDFWSSTAMLVAVDRACAENGIERVLVTLGNHELWATLTPMLDAQPGEPIRLSQRVFALPRPYRFWIGETSVLSLGGAASVDRGWRVPGKEWWADERITDAMVEEAIAGGPVDAMLTHESPAGSPVPAVRRVLRTNPLGFTRQARDESRDSRIQVSRVWAAVQPATLFHGHMHILGGGRMDDGRRVISLGCDGQAGNVVIWDPVADTLDYVGM
ncbi:metallophosphoesterase [Microbacterium sp. M]|uniref:metallophosphoesterase n=1 Tax=Microbacterium sp. M TaxID=3377125 RepID=UPI003869FCD4